MEHVSPEERELNRLLRVNRLLKTAFIIILALLSIFIGKHFLIAVISVEKAGLPTNNVLSIIKYHVLAFSDSFSDITYNYMLFVSFILFANLVGLTVTKLAKIPRPRGFSIMVFVVSLIIAFNIPMDKVYPSLQRNGKASAMLFCLMMMSLVPHFLGNYFTEDEVSTTILSKLFYVIVFGLLLTQLFIEHRFSR
jgi:hypothetical protein